MIVGETSYELSDPTIDLANRQTEIAWRRSAVRRLDVRNSRRRPSRRSPTSAGSRSTFSTSMRARCRPRSSPRGSRSPRTSSAPITAGPGRSAVEGRRRHQAPISPSWTNITRKATRSHHRQHLRLFDRGIAGPYPASVRRRSDARKHHAAGDRSEELHWQPGAARHSPPIRRRPITASTSRCR